MKTRQVFDTVTRVCGLGRLLVISNKLDLYLNIINEIGYHCDEVDYNRNMLNCSIAIFRPIFTPSRNTDKGKFDIIFIDILKSTILKEDLSKLVTTLNDVGEQFVFHIVDDQNSDKNVKEYLESICIKNNLRKHPRAMQVFNFEELEHSTFHELLFMQAIPTEAKERYSLDAVKKERNLHMDMLREGGRRSDAHLARYYEACKFVRGNDCVLDCACGLGYGSYLLATNSLAKRIHGIDISPWSVEYASLNYSVPGITEFTVGDALNLSALPEHSIDFVVSFETLEHLPRPLKFLDGIAKLLKGGGKLMISVPYKWPVSPNSKAPYHCQEYDYHRFYEELSRYFKVNKMFYEIAGKSARWMNEERTFREITLATGFGLDPEWLIALCETRG